MPKGAEPAFNAIESHRAPAYLPRIDPAELIHVGLDGKLRHALGGSDVQEAVEDLPLSNIVSIEGFPESDRGGFLRLPIPELPERVIATQFQARGASLGSNDTGFGGIEGLEIVRRQPTAGGP